MRIDCAEHGKAFETFICAHLLSEPAQPWFSEISTEEDRWPDAWCAACDQEFEKHGDWAAADESVLDVKLVCHHCYEKFRSQAVELS